MFRIWLYRDGCWAPGEYTDLDQAISEAMTLEKACAVHEFAQGRYVAILEVNV